MTSANSSEDDTYIALLKPTFQDVRDAMNIWYQNDNDTRSVAAIPESLYWSMKEYKDECQRRNIGLIHETRI